MRAVKVLTDPRAGVRLKASSVTVSTVGLVPQIERFCEDAGNGASLAISLHAVTDDIRDKVWFRGVRLELCVRALCVCFKTRAWRCFELLFVFRARFRLSSFFALWRDCSGCWGNVLRVDHHFVVFVCYVPQPTFWRPWPSLPTLFRRSLSR